MSMWPENYTKVYAVDRQGSNQMAVFAKEQPMHFKFAVPAGYTMVANELRYRIQVNIDYKLLWRDIPADTFFYKKFDSPFDGVYFTVYKNLTSIFSEKISTMDDVFWKIPKVDKLGILDTSPTEKTFIFRSIFHETVQISDHSGIRFDLMGDFSGFSDFRITASGILVKDQPGG